MHQREKGRQTMEKLTDLPNIGPKLAENLEKAGIETPDQLRELGAETAFLRIRTQADSTACLHQLEALERRRVYARACCLRSARRS